MDSTDFQSNFTQTASQKLDTLRFAAVYGPRASAVSVLTRLGAQQGIDFCTRKLYCYRSIALRALAHTFATLLKF